MGLLLGYAPVSTADQKPALQLDALNSAGCHRVFTDKTSGALDERPPLVKVFDQLRPGDTLVVSKLDRLGRSLRHLIDTISELREQDVGFRSLQENIDTTTPGGKLIFHISAQHWWSRSAPEWGQIWGQSQRHTAHVGDPQRPNTATRVLICISQRLSADPSEQCTGRCRIVPPSA